MELPVNAFKQALAEGRQQIGLWCNLVDSVATEVCAGAGYDWLLLDSEHAPNDVRTVLTQLQCIAPYQCHGVVRPPTNDAVAIKRYLDVGAQTLLIPCVETAEQATTIVSSATYPPTGFRGVSTQTRAGRWGRIPNYLIRAGEEICIIVQIETVQGLKEAESIAAVEGVDAIFIGPSDLSASLGYPGQPTAPQVVDAIDQIAAAAQAAGKPLGILTVDRALAQRCINNGFLFAAIGIDTDLLASASTALLAQIAKESA